MGKFYYMNNQFSEYIGCNIFRICGFETQDTLLGYFTAPTGTKKLVVGCKDFTQDGGILYEFSKLANQVQVDGKYGTSIESVADIVNKNHIIKDKTGIFSKFWDMFVVDALIGNSDRHFDNWGVIDRSNEVAFAPIYDCGSSLAALISEEAMETLLSDSIRTDFKNREFNIVSCYSMNGKRIFYHEIFKNPPKELEEAIKRVVPKIEITAIIEFIESITVLSDIRKEYMKESVIMRYEQILLPALIKVMK